MRNDWLCATILPGSCGGGVEGENAGALEKRRRVPRCFATFNIVPGGCALFILAVALYFDSWRMIRIINAVSGFFSFSSSDAPPSLSLSLSLTVLALGRGG